MYHIIHRVRSCMYALTHPISPFVSHPISPNLILHISSYLIPSYHSISSYLISLLCNCSNHIFLIQLLLERWRPLLSAHPNITSSPSILHSIADSIYKRLKFAEMDMTDGKARVLVTSLDNTGWLVNG